MGTTSEAFLALAGAVDELVHVWRIVATSPGPRLELGWVNAAFEQRTSLRLPLENPERLVPTEDRSALEAALTAFLASPDRVSSPFALRFEDGGVPRSFWSVAHKNTFRGEPALLVVSKEQDAERPSADDRRFRLMVENFNDILLIMDKDGIERFVSPSCRRVLGFGPEELVGHHGLTFVHPDDHAGIRAGLTGATRGGVPSVMLEFRHAHRDGGHRWLEASCTSLLADPSVAGIVMVARDVTARKRAEEERVRLEEHLRHAQKLESVGRLAGGIAHDFNNLLTAIKGNVSLLLDGLSAVDPRRELLEEVDHAASSATNLTRQLLAFSRRQVIAPRVLELAEVLGQLQKMLARILGEPIALRTAVAPDLHRVKLDPGQLEQVLVNLAVNARDAMPEGGSLSIAANNEHLDERAAAACHLAPGDYVKLEVEDSGSGMSAETRAHLFEPFFTTKEVGKGTGLGLATVYGIVKQNHGHIEVADASGHGTTFTIFLPRTEEAPSSRQRTPSGSRLGTETLLLVEDDARVRSLGTRVLERLGYTVHAFANGEAALAALDTIAPPIHLLLTDVVMPGMNGRVLAERLQARVPGLKVLLTSGYAADELTDRVEAGVEFLEKPYTTSALAARLREILGS
ncbi:MAG: PAS domain S-box protein [Myxococcales bacterium]|nr:PAS domain S-box protein [Myxococcales bacterium]